MLAAGFIGRVGTDGMSDVSKNVAASFGLIFTYALLIAFAGSASKFAGFAENFFGGVPYLNDIADYGSLHKMFSQSPLTAATNFLDTVILSTVIDIILLLPLGQDSDKKHFFTNRGNIMTNLFVSFLAAILGLLILNYVIKKASIYRSIVSIIGGIIAFTSIGTIPLHIMSLFNKNSSAGIGIIGALLLFSKSRIVGILRSAILKAIVFVCGIWILENRFGSLANGLSQAVAIMVAFGPVLVMIVGIVLILKSAKL